MGEGLGWGGLGAIYSSIWTGMCFCRPFLSVYMRVCSAGGEVALMFWYLSLFHFFPVCIITLPLFTPILQVPAQLLRTQTRNTQRRLRR